MGLSGEKGPLGEEIKGKRKRKKREWGGGGTMAPRVHEGGAPSPPLAGAPLLAHVGLSHIDKGGELTPSPTPI